MWGGHGEGHGGRVTGGEGLGGDLSTTNMTNLLTLPYHWQEDEGKGEWDGGGRGGKESKVIHDMDGQR